MTKAQDAAVARQCDHENLLGELREALKSTRTELQACQAVIHLSGEFDPAYVKGAQAALKQADVALAKADAC